MIKNKIVKYYARKDSNIALKVIPGHFVTNHSHLNYYLDYYEDTSERSWTNRHCHEGLL